MPALGPIGGGAGHGAGGHGAGGHGAGGHGAGADPPRQIPAGQGPANGGAAPHLPDGAFADFIRAHTRLAAPGLVPEVVLHLSSDPWQLWEAAEQAFGGTDLSPPFWAFAWAGGQALARFILDNPDVARGRRVLDLATGSGIVAIAARRAGASAVTATDIDPLAIAAVALNATANRVSIAAHRTDVLGGSVPAGSPHDDPATACGGRARRAGCDAETVLVADAFYERELASQVMRFLDGARARAATVLAADIGRRFLPRGRFRELAAYDVPVLAGLEDAQIKRAAVLAPAW